MSELTLDIVNNTVRPSFEKNVKYVDKYLVGKGIDMGCGSCPLIKEDCLHYDISPQPIAEEQVDNFIQANVLYVKPKGKFDYIFSSHMVEDLPNRGTMKSCLEHWASMVKEGGHIALLIPDMEGGRYPKVEEEGNCSHQTNVGLEFFTALNKDLSMFKLVQIDTIPHDISETMDVVFLKGKE